MIPKIAIVISDFNKEISENLLAGAFAKFELNKFNKNDLDVFHVPGAFEIPGLIKQIIKSDSNYNAIIAYGCVIKGETAHFEYISESVSNALLDLSINDFTDIPILFGILTTYNKEQAIKRSCPAHLDKGGEVMQAAIDTIKVYNKLS